MDTTDLDTAELIDQVAKVLRLLQRELDEYVAEHEAAFTTEDVLRCQRASGAIDALVPALRDARSTQESKDLLSPSPPCPDYDSF
jgi:phosphomevalonate kinase